MKRFIAMVMMFVFLFGLVSAIEVNYTGSEGTTTSALKITQLKYEPYPVNPGEYFDLWIKAEWTGTGHPRDAVFELLPTYPFSLDPSEDSVRDFGQINNEPIVMKYKVRVDKDAIEGVNTLDLKYDTDLSTTNWGTKSFDIQVADAQTDFDLVVQESTDTDVSIAVANIGKNTANSLIVRIPDQSGYRVSGTNGQMVGNLDSGDYSIVSFGLAQLGRANSNSTLQVQLDYTDSIGERRSVLKDVRFVSSSPVGVNITGRTGGSYTGGNFQRNATQTKSVFSSIWFWIILVFFGGLGYYSYRKNPDRILSFFNSKKKTRSGSEQMSNIPDWVSAERTKKR